MSSRADSQNTLATQQAPFADFFNSCPECEPQFTQYLKHLEAGFSQKGFVHHCLGKKQPLEFCSAALCHLYVHEQSALVRSSQSGGSRFGVRLVALPEITQGLLLPGHENAGPLPAASLSRREARTSQKPSLTLGGPGPKALLPISDIEAALEFMRPNRRRCSFC